MMMLHSVWSGGGSAAARKKAMTLLALLALLASVLVWAPSGSLAQANDPPNANAGLDTTTNAGESVDLNGSGSFDSDDDDDPGTLCSGCRYSWEIMTGPYDWIEITNSDQAAAMFTAPSQAFVDKVSDSDPQKYEIVVELTVTDNDGASDTDTVSVFINRRPVADIQLYAGLLDQTVVDPDASIVERYSLPGVIDGPGENGNRDNEWDIMEGAYLVLDGSGSTDENPQTGMPSAYLWSRNQLRPNTASGFAPGQAAGGAGNQRFVVGTTGTDGNLLPDLGAGESVTVFYSLTVADAGGLSGTSVIRIVVHDTSSEPEVAISAGLTTASSTRGDAMPQATVSQFTGVDNQFVVAAGSAVVLTATVTDRDQSAGHVIRWSGATSAPDTPNMGTVRVSPGADDGDTIDVSVTVIDATRLAVTTAIQLVVGENTRPTASGVPTNRGVAGSPQIPAPPISVHQINDGFQSQRDGNTVTLRGVAYDADGDSLITAWAQRAISATATVPGDAQTLTRDAFNEAYNAYVAAYALPDSDATKQGSLAGAIGQMFASGVLQALVEPEEPLLTLNGELTDTVTFEVPQLDNADWRAGDPVNFEDTFLLFNAIDSNGVAGTQFIYLRVVADDDLPMADAGPDQQVDPGAFVRLNATGSSDPDLNDVLSYEWEYVGATMSPAPENRAPLTESELEELEGWILRTDLSGQDFGYIVNSAGSIVRTNGAEVDSLSDLTGAITRHLKATNSPYPYFDAPELTGFDTLRLTFRVRVTDIPGTDLDGDGVLSQAPIDADPYDEAALGLDLNGDCDTNDMVDLDGQMEWEISGSDCDTVTITIVNRYFSGAITGPDYCTGLSLGGPQAYAFDSDGDGVADICSLNTTRRATIARQNALTTLAKLNAAEFRTAVLAVCGAAGFKTTNYGDDPDDLANDVCETEQVTSPPSEVSPGMAGEFYSGTITGPDYCTNFSLGGARTYAYDSDDDGVADICSLPTTRREAIARQNGLNHFANDWNAADETLLNELRELLNLSIQAARGQCDTDCTNRASALRAKYAEYLAARGVNDVPRLGNTISDEGVAARNALQAVIEGLESRKGLTTDRYVNALDVACDDLGDQDFGDDPSDLARDACAPDRPVTGVPFG